MKKVKLLGLSKSNKHSKYTFKKTQEIFKMVDELFDELGNEGDGWWNFRMTEDSTPDKYREKDIRKCFDELFILEIGEYYIEVIMFKNKVHLIIHSEKNRQNKIAKILGKHIIDEILNNSDRISILIK